MPYKSVKLNTDSFKSSSFINGDKVWKVASLIQQVEDQKLDVFDLPLCCIDLSVSVWGPGDLRIKDFVEQWKIADEVNLDYPVILDDNGFIMDGWHRVAKALFLGYSTIKAVRFDKTPDCDYLRVED